MLVCLGPCAVHAPNLDRLAGRGLTFIHAYCQQAICSPSRNSFMSGFRPQRTKGQQHEPLFECTATCALTPISSVRSVFNFVSDFRQELPYVLSFPQYFKQHGYTVLGHGKM